MIKYSNPREFSIKHAQNGAVVVIEEGTGALLGAYSDRFEALEAIASDWGFTIKRGAIGLEQSMGQGFYPTSVAMEPGMSLGNWNAANGAGQ